VRLFGDDDGDDDNSDDETDDDDDDDDDGDAVEIAGVWDAGVSRVSK
jgi:hypothetical protein